MAKQLNLLVNDRVIPTALHAEMQRSYLEYAMSVIVGRALPDVRDGLKPVHRRIVYAMHELGLTPDRPYRKCARVVGDVLGKYHPHGDQAVYDALVRMVQEFSSRYPLLAGHGNFGSVDNDPPAAMRYTETRLASISHEALLGEIGEATVDFTGNFDNSQQEPTVLPAQLPILLLNGCAGIAVGMATNIPPHNLGEIVDGLIALIDKPDLPDEKLFELIPGPDFPTGGEIIGTSGIREAYSTGRGSIPVQGVASIEEIQGSKGRQKRQAIVVTEFPFQVNKSSWIEKIAELVNGGKIQGISDLRDESDREGLRVVIELKRDTNPQEILAQLYRQTALCTNFGAILLALVDGQPRILTLRQMLDRFLSFREQTLTRQYTHELGEARRRLHIVEGILTALTNLDAAIAILRNAPDGSTAKLTLSSEFNISDSQADAILAMPLRRLTGMERQNLQQEFDQLSGRIDELEGLLNDRRELLKALKKDLRSLKRKYADPRRTRIRLLKAGEPESKAANEKESKGTDDKGNKGSEKSKNPKSQLSNPKSQEQENPKSPAPNLQLHAEPAEEEVVVEITQRGYVRRLPKTGNKSASAKSNDDFAVQTKLISTEQDLVVLTKLGKAYPVKVGDIPPTSGGSKGTALIQLLPTSAQSETVTGHFFLADAQKADLLLLTKQGKIKRLPMLELATLSGRGLTLIKLKDNDELQYATLTKAKDQVVIATSGGRLLRLLVNDEHLPLTGRLSSGVPALRVGRQEQIVGCFIGGVYDNILLVSQLGYAKRMPVCAMPLSVPGNIGTQALQFTSKTDSMAGMVAAPEGESASLATSTQRIVRIAVDSVKLFGKDGAGDRIRQLNPDEKVISVISCR
ncbi:DNA topoisomerase 4 subunit A [Microcoleus sp. FACHB-831]|uniref:DNA gyrase/topoisomerase IV subunit A n=1 Tax=Microcoleus sp. FACHB-831 TaxID=2692827 RepID=UPI0016841AF8|nr:DNA topoisomerase (ATP-hydrolyzing) [Microcoleus sp. FACHB-831]MBD1920184.1 DNA topoisomerase 4 subunit A [Microcoleus sp. FACHB-831]